MSKKRAPVNESPATNPIAGAIATACRSQAQDARSGLIGTQSLRPCVDLPKGGIALVDLAPFNL